MPSIPELEIIRRAQIVEAAMSTISANGYGNVTMDDICKAANLSKGGLAHYFQSKNELFKAAFEEFFNRIFERSRLTLEAIDNPIEKVFSFEWLYDETDADAVLGYPLLFDCISLAVHQSDYREMYHNWVNNWIKLLQNALNEAIATGLLQEIDTEATARTISAIYNGLATRWYLDRNAHSSEWAISSFKRSISGLLAPHLIQASSQEK